MVEACKDLILIGTKWCVSLLTSRVTLLFAGQMSRDLFKNGRICKLRVAYKLNRNSLRGNSGNGRLSTEMHISISSATQFLLARRFSLILHKLSRKPQKFPSLTLTTCGYFFLRWEKRIEIIRDLLRVARGWAKKWLSSTLALTAGLVLIRANSLCLGLII